ncbi:FimB/Mfa2 family fimbrial subunit [Alistipes onderdonkii]|uniref:FimB/Mfa2 family fimbrial subunit n=1 Tax=Alistipes onderdonkii TaxID=328813 RepID=UPI0036F4289C
MKKFLLMATVGMMMFSACSNDGSLSEITNNGEARPVELSMDFTVSSGAETRAGRPLYSSEALQQVNDLKLYIFKENQGAYKYSKAISVEAFKNAEAQGTESHTYKFTEKLADGKYQFLAIGFEEDQAYKAPNFTENTTLEQAVLELKDNNTKAEEVFAGLSAEYVVGAATQSLTASVKLNRVVAGVLGYFKNIPYEVEKDSEMKQVKKVCVELVNKGTAAALKDNTTNANAGTAYKMLTIDLSSKEKDGDNNWYRNEAGTKPATVANSFLAGGYVLPFNKSVGQSTFKVVLCGEGDVVLKTYKVQVEGSADTDLDVLANHFYSLGKKVKNDTTTGGGDGDEDDDKPIDLSKDQIITITVNANWETIHDLELGDEVQ